MDSLHFLYKTVSGRFLLKLLASRKVSRLCGAFLDSPCSAFLIKSFVKKNKINTDDYELTDVKTFNQFFRRKIKDGKRTFDMDEKSLISPCDGLLLVHEIKDSGTVISVKQSQYTISSLLNDEQLAKEFFGGYCLIFRLCVNHYHRYVYAMDGQKGKNIFIPGKLHTVRPIALETLPVFTENCREYTVIDSPVFGKTVQMEVGAMLVGRIVNHDQEGTAVRGKEKGFFEYGGSTIILLIQKDKLVVNNNFLQNSKVNVETSVQMGEKIGVKA